MIKYINSNNNIIFNEKEVSVHRRYLFVVHSMFGILPNIVFL